MQKRITGYALIGAAALLAIHPLQSAENNQSSVVAQQESIKANKQDSIASSQVPVTLVKIVDGDTIKVRLNGKQETVRYLLIDTPESKKPATCVQPYAMEAYIRNKELLKNGQLTLEFEQGNTRDAYGRLLAYVYVDGKSVQESLLNEGLARVAYILNPPYKYLKLYRVDEVEDKKSRVLAKKVVS